MTNGANEQRFDPERNCAKCGGREEEARAMFDWVLERSRFPDVRSERAHLPSTSVNEEQT